MAESHLTEAKVFLAVGLVMFSLGIGALTRPGVGLVTLGGAFIFWGLIMLPAREEEQHRLGDMHLSLGRWHRHQRQDAPPPPPEQHWPDN